MGDPGLVLVIHDELIHRNRTDRRHISKPDSGGELVGGQPVGEIAGLSVLTGGKFRLFAEYLLKLRRFQ